LGISLSFASHFVYHFFLFLFLSLKIGERNKEKSVAGRNKALLQKMFLKPVMFSQQKYNTWEYGTSNY